MNKTLQKPLLVVVLGMHRSGTSAVAKSLEIFGVSLGKSLIAAQADNPKGFWEDELLVSLNIRLLQELGSYTDSLTPLADDALEAVLHGPFATQAKDYLSSRLKDHPHFGIKDPRMPRLLRFWCPLLKTLGVETRYVITLRHPGNVVRSLQRREELSAEKCYWMWVVHMIECLPLLRSPHTVVIDYDRLMTSPADELLRVGRRLDLPANPETLDTFTRDFLDDNLRHNRDPADGLDYDPACPPLAFELYQALMLEARDESAITDAQLQVWRKRLDECQSSFRLIDQLQTDAAQQRDIALNLRSNHEVLNKRLNSLSQQLTDLDAANTSLSAQLEAVTSRLQSLAAQLADKNVSLSSADERIRMLSDKIHRMQTSVSWRITSPLRFLRRLLTGH